MANPEHVAILSKGREHWNEWRNGAGKHVTIDLDDVELRGKDLTGYDLSEANLTKAGLSNANLSNANLDHAILRHANLTLANFQNAQLNNADLRGADLSFATFRRARIHGIKVDGATVLDTVRVEQIIAVFHEDEQTIQIATRDRWLNWGRLRLIGRFPLFGVSWGALVLAMVSVNTIGLLNAKQLLDFIDYPIPIPHRMTWILISSVLLVLGSTVYVWACPQRVLEFSEIEWVEEQGKVRLHYLAASLSHRVWQWPAAFFTLFGGLIAIGLVIERIVMAFRYIF